MVELFTPSIAIVTQLKKLHHFSHLALETSLQCNCSSKYSAGYKKWQKKSMSQNWFEEYQTCKSGSSLSLKEMFVDTTTKKRRFNENKWQRVVEKKTNCLGIVT